MIKPDKINANDPDSFAYYTIMKRFPHIIDEIIANNVLNTQQKSNLEKLKLDMHKDKWLKEPFMDVEFYFYRQILDALDYFDNKIDPYKLVKQNALLNKITEIKTIAADLDKKIRPLKELLVYNLWSNRADLSLIRQAESTMPDSNENNIIINDIDNILEFFKNKLNQVDIILDNSGLELSTDLIFCYYLMEEKIADKLFLHTKSYPIFVSDAIPDDVLYTLAVFAESDDMILKKIAIKLLSNIEAGQIIIAADQFWTSCGSFLDLNGRLNDHFNNSDLVIIKGDLNYRRLVEDRYWEYTENIHEVVDYFPTSILIIRSLKSELMLGLSNDDVQQLFRKDPEWLTNGKYGVIQLIIKVVQFCDII